jgi:hypothetical protein
MANGVDAVKGVSMKFSPTWKVWRLLHSYLSLDMYRMLVMALRLKRPPSGVAYLSNVWTWIVLSFLLSSLTNFLNSYFFMSSPMGRNMATALVSVLPFLLQVFITVVCLRYALHFTNAISAQRETGNYDLFATLPAGEFVSVMNIARTYRHPLQGVISGSISAVLLLGLLILVTASAPISFNPAFVDVNNLAFTILPVMVTGIGHFVNYLQSFVAVTLISLLVSQRQQRGETSMWLVGSFLALQIAFYIVAVGVSSLTGGVRYYTIIGSFGPSLIFLSYTLYLGAQVFIMIAVREAVNAVLWRLVKRQMEVS